MFMELVFITICLWLSLILTWYLNFYKYNKYLKNLPGPTPLPIVGNALEVSSPSDVLRKLSEWKEKYGGIYKLCIGFTPITLVVSEQKFLEFLLGTTVVLRKSLIYEFIGSWLGTGLLTSTGAKWRKHRKIIAPAFHFKILEQFVGVFEKNVNVLLEILKEEVNSNSFDVYRYITNMTLDIICETALGTEINAQRDSHSEYVESVKEMCRIAINRTISPFHTIGITYKLTGLYRKEQRVLKILHSATNSVIQSRKHQMQNRISNKEEDEGLGIKNKLVFLDLLLESTLNGRLLTDEELREEVDTFMFAGHDTTAVGISFALYNLSIYPEVQRKVVEELNTIFGDDVSRASTLSDLQEMKYLEAVIKETLRLFPPVPFIGRTVDESFEYEGIQIPTGTHITVFAYGIMRDPKYFPNPEKFDPDRFFNNNNLYHNSFTYIPFSAGPRNCIGQKFAILEMKCAISKILKHYEIVPAEPPSGLELSPEITLKAMNGINIGIRRRRL